MRTILKDLLHAINVLGDDRDVYVDGYGTIAVCPPIKLTQEGLRHFNKSLNAAVEVIYKDDCHHSTYISDDEEDVDEEAWNLLVSLAGCCPKSDFDKWFEGNTAEFI